MAKTVFITGGGGGIGLATARVLTRKGWNVALFDLDQAGLDAAAAELGARCLALRGDVCSLASLEGAMARTRQTFGAIDAIFANAGIAKINPVLTMDESEWLRVIDINLNGVWRTLKAASPHLLASKGYALVMSSASSTVCLPMASHYTASKAAVLNLAEAWRAEMYGFGVDVGTLHPMFIRTAMVEDAVWGTDIGRDLAAGSKLLFLNYPLGWTANAAARMITRRKRRATVPFTHLPVVWFPRFLNGVTNLLAFRKGQMLRLMQRYAGEKLK